MSDTKSLADSRKFVAFTHTFSDPWSADNAEDAQDVSFTFHFAKPGKQQIQRLQDKAGKNPSQAARNLLIDVIRPDEKDALLQAMEDYPGIATSFSTAIIKGVGISTELGN